MILMLCYHVYMIDKTFTIRRNGSHDYIANVKLQTSLTIDQTVIPFLNKIDNYFVTHQWS